MDLTTLTEVELKALAYEQVLALKQAEQNIVAVEKELFNRKEKTSADS